LVYKIARTMDKVFGTKIDAHSRLTAAIKSLFTRRGRYGNGKKEIIMFRRLRLMSSGIAVAILSGSLAAQGLGQLKDIIDGSGLSGAASSLGSLSSITAGSIGNAVGIIEYCVKNNYLSGDNASSVKDQLMGKMTASGDQPAENNPDYISGARGIVTGSSGQSVDLSMAGLKDKAVKKICKKILDQANSML
jgi:hypothetical protein